MDFLIKDTLRALCHMPPSLWSDVLRSGEVLLKYLLRLAPLLLPSSEPPLQLRASHTQIEQPLGRC